MFENKGDNISEEIKENQEPFMNMNLHIIQHQGKPALQFRKMVTLCDKNKDFWEKIINASFSGASTKIVGVVSFSFYDKIKAKNKLEACGFKIINNNKKVVE